MKNLTTVVYYLFCITTISSFTYSASHDNTFFFTNSPFSSISQPNDSEYRILLPSIILPETIDHIDEKVTSIFDEEEEVISIYLDDKDEITSVHSQEHEETFYTADENAEEGISNFNVSYVSSPTNSIESTRSCHLSPLQGEYLLKSNSSLSSLKYSPSPTPSSITTEFSTI